MKMMAAATMRFQSLLALCLAQLALSHLSLFIKGFVIPQRGVRAGSFFYRTPRSVRISTLLVGMTSSDDANPSSSSTGDPLRAATGIRPSLHPTTINAIAEALKIRAAGDDPDTPLIVDANGHVKPLDVALSAGKIAATAIEKRQRSSEQDGMALTAEEGQTIAGRVVGVVMRFQELEDMLSSRVRGVEWVKKYNEWATFGVLEDESELNKRIKTDPLFTLSRAECLLALFLDNVEAPQMEKIGLSAPGGSGVDFLDADRQEVLLTFQ